jgi:hypothetical protein
MEDKEFLGKIVYLTPFLDEWLRKTNPGFNVPMLNRLAKVVKIFDWDTEEGKLLLQIRKKSPKWEEHTSTDFKFVLKVYHPDLRTTKAKRPGLTILEHMPRNLPGTDKPLFALYPSWMIENFLKEEKDVLEVKENTIADR